MDRSALSVKPLAEFFYTGEKKAYPIYGGLASSGKYEGIPLRRIPMHDLVTYILLKTILYGGVFLIFASLITEFIL